VAVTHHKILIEPTSSHLKKANIDLSKELEEFLTENDILDVSLIEKGVENKRLIEIQLDVEGNKSKCLMSVYRTNNRGTRFWVSNLASIISSGESMTFCIQNGEVSIHINKKSTKRTPWTDDELSIVVRSYVAMRNAILSGQKIVKKQVYESISQQEAFLVNNRSPKSIEFRFCNISTVMEKRGEHIISGLLPRENVGAGLEQRIQLILDEIL
jgi:hypothetical protein